MNGCESSRGRSHFLSECSEDATTGARVADADGGWGSRFGLRRIRTVLTPDAPALVIAFPLKIREADCFSGRPSYHEGLGERLPLQENTLSDFQAPSR